ncbi:MAG: hypothetical protein FJX46_09030 [Alphaproteobacteria bacterium]|nr:hypothetical protein [Alphaproteobacteria bacterium]
MRAIGLLGMMLVWASIAPVSLAQMPINSDAIAIVIGNRTYKHPRVPAVDYAHNDAEAMRRFVVEVLGYREGNVVVLKDASQAEMISAFGSAEDHQGHAYRLVRPKRSDLTVFFSGHGVPGRAGGGYLLPSDADPATAELNGYALRTLFANLAKLEARSVTILIDACFSGDSPKGRLIESASPVFVRGALPAAASGLTVLTAAQSDQLASWDHDARHGLFTQHVLEGLYGAADADQDGHVTAVELKAYLDEEMTYAARRRFNRQQHPSLLGDENRVLASFPAGRPPPRPYLIPPTPAPAPAMALAPVPRATGPQAAVGSLAPPQAPRSFRDCADCPEMIRIPSGSFVMGSPPDEPGRYDEEGPQRRLAVPAFALGKYEVTRAEYAAFVAATDRADGAGCRHLTRPEDEAPITWRDAPYGEGPRHPVSCVSWQDARAYAEWLARRTGRRYRLPSEAEWEYAARAGSAAATPWAAEARPICAFANIADKTARLRVPGALRLNLAECDDGQAFAAPVGSYPPNAFGLHDIIGNVFEWTEDCWNAGYDGAPAAAVSWRAGHCANRVLRGGSWLSTPGRARTAFRDWLAADQRSDGVGFRVAREE